VALPGDPEPEYFLINGISGMLSTEDHATNLSGHSGGLGEPGDATLVRMINTGRAPRSVCAEPQALAAKARRQSRMVMRAVTERSLCR